MNEYGIRILSVRFGWKTFFVFVKVAFQLWRLAWAKKLIPIYATLLDKCCYECNELLIGPRYSKSASTVAHSNIIYVYSHRNDISPDRRIASSECRASDIYPEACYLFRRILYCTYFSQRALIWKIPDMKLLLFTYSCSQALRIRARRAKASRKPHATDLKPGIVIENVAQTRKLAETTLGTSTLLPSSGGGSSYIEEGPTCTGSGSQVSCSYHFGTSRIFRLE